MSTIAARSPDQGAHQGPDQGPHQGAKSVCAPRTRTSQHGTEVTPRTQSFAAKLPRHLVAVTRAPMCWVRVRSRLFEGDGPHIDRTHVSV